MKLAKSIATILLLLFVGATVGTLIAQEVSRPKIQLAETDESALPVETSVPATSETSTSEPNPVVNEPEPSEADVVDGTGAADEVIGETPALAPPSDGTSSVIEAIYFHNTYRCVTCLNIENEAKAIVEETYAAELAAGKLRWSAINMEEERAYISQYELAMPSLVLIRKVGDEVVDWIRLDDTWSTIRSSTRFRSYIVDSFQTFLEGCL